MTAFRPTLPRAPHLTLVSGRGRDPRGPEVVPLRPTLSHMRLRRIRMDLEDRRNEIRIRAPT